MHEGAWAEEQPTRQGNAAVDIIQRGKEGRRNGAAQTKRGTAVESANALDKYSRAYKNRPQKI